MAAADCQKEKMDSAMEEDTHDGAEEEDEDIEEIEEEEEEGEEEEGEDSVTHGRRSGRGLTLMTLLKEKVLQPGLGNMTINYLGNKFKGDLLSDGRIRSQETGKVFGTPSAWAIYCKQIVNPNKKSGCGWASVKYRGKKLDEYKNNWNRQKRLEFEREGDELESGAGDEDAGSCSESEGGETHDHEILEFDVLNTRHDAPYTGNPLVELSTFSSLGRLQPFTVAASSSAMAVLDLHVHLSRGEAAGFLAGQWDVNNHNLIVSHAFPLCCDAVAAGAAAASSCGYTNNNNTTVTEAGRAAEAAIHRQMASLKLALVGWYHSHPHSAPLPSLKDIDCQLDYEMKMKGTNDASYTPCIGFIASPFNDMAGDPLGRHHAGRGSCSWGSSTTAVSGNDAAPSLASDNTLPGIALTSTSSSSPATGIATNGDDGSSSDAKPGTVSAEVDLVLADGIAQSTKLSTEPTSTCQATVSGEPQLSAFESSKGSAPPVKQGSPRASTTSGHASTKTTNLGLTAMNCFWVMPPPEHRPHEYPRPMSVVYNVVQDAFVPKEALIHMRECVKFYSNSDDSIKLNETFVSGITYWDRLKMAIKARVPKDHYPPLIEYLHKILRIKYLLPDLILPPSPVPSREEKTTLPQQTDLLARSVSPLSSLLMKSRDTGLDISVRGSSRALLAGTALADARSRPYPDPSKIHPLLVDRSDERTLQPLILDRGTKTGITHPLLADQAGEKVHIHQILTEQSDGARTDGISGREAASPGVPLPATTNPPDYPFPLLRGMMAEQASSIQRQQEQRYEDDLGLQKDKLSYRPPLPSLLKTDGSQPITEKDLLVHMNEKFLQQQRLQALDQHDSKSKLSESKIQSVTSLFTQLSAALPSRSESSPPAYTSSGFHQQFSSPQGTPQDKEASDPHRGSPPPYPVVSSKHVRDLSIFPAPLSSKVTDQYKKSSDNSSRSSDRETPPSSSVGASLTFSPINLLSSLSNNESNSSLLHNLTITPTSSSAQLSVGGLSSSIPAALSITSVTRSSPVNFAGHQANANSSSRNMSSQSGALSSSPLTLQGQHSSNLSSPFYPPPASNLSSSPLSSSHTPNLSPSPISFNPPRNASPSLSSSASVEVSPRHTEWAQNALPGMARPPLISVKSQAALSQQPYSPVTTSSGSGSSNTSVSAADISLSAAALSELAARTSGAGSNPALSQATLADVISSGAAADHWMQASFAAAGLPQFPGFAAAAAAAQYSKPPPQYSEQQQQHYQQFRSGLSLLPSTATDHPLLHPQEPRK